MVGDYQWQSCDGLIRNLYFTVTRVKDSSKKVEDQGMQIARQLQYYPNGTKFADIELTFSNSKEGFAAYIKVAFFALAAGIATFAF